MPLNWSELGVNIIIFFSKTYCLDFFYRYGKFHPGRELTAIEMENFWFAVKPISVWIYLQDFCAFVYVSIFLGKRSSSILFTSFTC